MYFYIINFFLMIMIIESFILLKIKEKIITTFEYLKKIWSFLILIT